MTVALKAFSGSATNKPDKQAAPTKKVTTCSFVLISIYDCPLCYRVIACPAALEFGRMGNYEPAKSQFGPVQIGCWVAPYLPWFDGRKQYSFHIKFHKAFITCQQAKWTSHFHKVWFNVLTLKKKARNFQIGISLQLGKHFASVCIGARLVGIQHEPASWGE